MKRHFYSLFLLPLLAWAQEPTVLHPLSYARGAKIFYNDSEYLVALTQGDIIDRWLDCEYDTLMVYNVSNPAQPRLLDDDIITWDYLWENDNSHVYTYLGGVLRWDNVIIATKNQVLRSGRGVPLHIYGPIEIFAKAIGEPRELWKITLLDSLLVHDDDYIDVYEPGQLVRFQNYLYIAAGSWGILIYDLSDVNNPELINTLDIICWEIVVDGNRLAVITSLDYNHINRLRLFDLTQPENPHYMGEIDLNWENRPTVFLSSANRGYIYGYGENREEIILLYIFDIGSEEAPILTGRMRLGFQSPRGISLAASGDRLYVKTERLIYLYDLADPAGPDSLGAVLVDSASYNDIAVSDNSLFISPGCTDGNDRHTPLNVQIYNVGPDAAPPLLKNNLPSICLLLECYPNPFNSTLTISYTLPIPSPVSLKVFDLSGREVATLTEGWREAGSYREVWEGKDAASGIYLLKGNFNKHQKIQTILLSR